MNVLKAACVMSVLLSQRTWCSAQILQKMKSQIVAINIEIHLGRGLQKVQPCLPRINFAWSSTNPAQTHRGYRLIEINSLLHTAATRSVYFIFKCRAAHWAFINCTVFPAIYCFTSKCTHPYFHTEELLLAVIIHPAYIVGLKGKRDPFRWDSSFSWS